VTDDRRSCHDLDVQRGGIERHGQLDLIVVDMTNVPTI